MDNSIYVALSRQLAVFRDLDMTANNIANADTTGFKAEKMIFTDYLVDDGNRNDMAFVQDISSYRDLSEGTLRSTGNPLDVAIRGNGYFAIQAPQGILYTKSGNFTLNNEGTLVTSDGFAVLDVAQQPIQLGNNDIQIVIGETGALSVLTDTPGAAREERGQIGMFEFADEQEMTQVNSQMLEANQAALDPVNSRMLQGVLERSNVSGVSEVVKLTKLSRSASSTAKFIEVMYDLQRKTSNIYAQSSNN